MPSEKTLFAMDINTFLAVEQLAKEAGKSPLKSPECSIFYPNKAAKAALA